MPASEAPARKLPPEFPKRVLDVVRRVPKGRLATYGQVALLAGFPGRARQVGMVLKGLPEGSRVPWHRIVNAQGHIPTQGRPWGALEQARRLRLEGVSVDPEGRLSLRSYKWAPGASREFHKPPGT